MELVAGRIARAHGLRGEVLVDVRTDRPDVRFAVGATLATVPRERGPLTVASARDDRGRLLVQFVGIADRADAEALRGTDLMVDVVDRSAAMAADAGAAGDAGDGDAADDGDDADAFYDHELVGLTAYDQAGRELGTICRVEHPPAHDLLVVARPEGEALVPFVKALVPEVDLVTRAVTIDAPGGLFDLGAPGAAPTR